MDSNEMIKFEIKKQIDEIRMGIQQNVVMQIKKAMMDNQEFMRKASMEAINRTINDSDNAYTLRPLSTITVMEILA